MLSASCGTGSKSVGYEGGVDAICELRDGVEISGLVRIVRVEDSSTVEVLKTLAHVGHLTTAEA